MPVQTFGTVSTVDINIPANSSVKLQTQDLGGSVLVGWVKVTSDRLLRAASIFQFSTGGEITREAGVADSLATGSANVFVSYNGIFDSGVAMVNPTEELAVVA